MRGGIARYAERSFSLAGFPSKQSPLALFALVTRDLLISWTNPASNFGGAGRPFLRRRTIGDFREKSNKSCLSPTGETNFWPF